MTQAPTRSFGAGVAQRLRRPGRVGETAHVPGDLGARSVRFAGALVLRPLPVARSAGTGRPPGQTLAAAIRVEVPVHRIAQVHAAGSMVVPRDLTPLQPPDVEPAHVPAMVLPRPRP